MSSSLCRAFMLCLVGSAIGCFNPRIKDDGFACVAATVDPCPAGYSCINNVCDDGHGNPPPVLGDDLAMSLAGDMAMAEKATPDMTKSPIADMAQPPIADLALGADMAKPVCGATGDACTHSSDCCSGHCHTSTSHVCFN